MVTSHNPESGTPEQQLGALIRLSREGLGWSQDELARRLRDVAGLKIDQSALARIENGGRGIRFNEAVALASILGFDLGIFDATQAGISDQEVVRAMGQLAHLHDELAQAQQAQHSAAAAVEEAIARMHEHSSEVDRIRAQIQAIEFAVSRADQARVEMQTAMEASDGDR